MRKSSRSLLRTYLGDGPSEAVWNGSIRRGERSSLEAVVMFCDLRGFTAMAEGESEEVVFGALNDYFETVVRSVEDNGGDVLKFMGDGVLSIFPISATADRADRCSAAARAALALLAGLDEQSSSRIAAGKPRLEAGIGLNAGRVSYGNIGSHGRLDFTVLGGAVNVASRVEGLTKTIGDRVLATASVAEHATDLFASRGHHTVRGLAAPVELFGLLEPTR